MAQEENAVRVGLLASGFIHREEDTLQLSMPVPAGISGLVSGFYPRLMPFELFSPNHFNVKDDGLELKGGCVTENRCDGYLIFPATPQPNGFQSGVHFWSVKLLGDPFVTQYCYRSIGVVSGKRDTTMLNKIVDRWPGEWLRTMDLISSSFYDGDEDYDEDRDKIKGCWGYEDTMTVKLDCDEGKVEYFINETSVMKDEINERYNYYFVMTSCVLPRHRYRVVETPAALLKFQNVICKTDLLISGYVRQEEKQISIIIPAEIHGIIMSFYPNLMKFELFSKTRFKLLNDGYEIQGRSPGRCDGFLIYPATLHPEGFSKGVHYWSVLLIGKENVTQYCFHSIGIMSEERMNTAQLEVMCDRWPEEWNYLDIPFTDDQQPATSDYYAYDVKKHGSDPNLKAKHYWGRGQTITVKLDCDNGTVHYFKDGEQLKCNLNIDKTRSYHFVMTSCVLSDNWFRVVDTPVSVIDAD